MSRSANMFDILSEDGPKQPAAKAPVAEVKEAAKVPVVTKKEQVGADKPARGPAQDSNRGAGRSDAAPRSNNREGAVSGGRGGAFSSAPSRKEFQGNDDKRGGRGGGRGRGNPRGRGRDFDRHSGTGRPANENKKQGAGAANWGKVGDEWDNVDQTAAAPVEGDKEAFDAVEKKEVPAEAPKAEERVEDEDAKLITMAEWEKQADERKKALAEKVGTKTEKRTVDASSLKGLHLLPSKKEESAVEATSEKKVAKAGPRAVNAAEVLRIVDADRAERSERRGGRGGRGGAGARGGRGDSRGGRGDSRGGRGDSRGGRPQQSSTGRRQQAEFDATVVNDDLFPSLSTKA